MMGKSKIDFFLVASKFYFTMEYTESGTRKDMV